MDMNNEQGSERGLIILKARKELEIDGVEDIFSFDETNLYIKTVLGNLNVDGEGLHIHQLSVEEGKIAVSGKIFGLFYETSEHKKKTGLFGRKN